MEIGELPFCLAISIICSNGIIKIRSEPEKGEEDSRKMLAFFRKYYGQAMPFFFRV